MESQLDRKNTKEHDWAHEMFHTVVIVNGTQSNTLYSTGGGSEVMFIITGVHSSGVCYTAALW